MAAPLKPDLSHARMQAEIGKNFLESTCQSLKDAPELAAWVAEVGQKVLKADDCVTAYKRAVNKSDLEAEKENAAQIYQQCGAIRKNLNTQVGRRVIRLPFEERDKLLANRLFSDTFPPVCRIVARAYLPPLLDPDQRMLQEGNALLRVEAQAAMERRAEFSPCEDAKIQEEVKRIPQDRWKSLAEGTDPASTPQHIQALNYIVKCIRCQREPQHEIVPGVWVGSYEALRQLDPNRGNNPRGYTRVITLTRYRDTPDSGHGFSEDSIPSHIKRYIVGVDDNGKAWTRLEGNFEIFFGWINHARLSGEPLLIHCQQGISRSVTVVLAYLVLEVGMPIDMALTYIRSKRAIANPNPELYEALASHVQHQQSQPRMRTALTEMPS